MPPIPRPVRFIQAKVEDLKDGKCRAYVEIDRPDVGTARGEAEGGPPSEDGLRTVARATGDAISFAFSKEGVRLRIRGVQAVEAFGHMVVIASVAASHGPNSYNFVGVCNSADNPNRAAALSVLNACNRLLGSL